MEKLLKVLFALLLLYSCNTEKVAEEKTIPSRPNILIITADDLGFSDLGCYGSQVQTPHLDKLAANGLRFSNFYTAGQGSPTRASLFTGLYPHETGLGGPVAIFGEERPDGPYQGYLKFSTKIIPELLSSVGYKNYMSGKWHVGENPIHWPMKRGFDHYFGLISGSSSYYKLTQDKTQARLMVKDDAPWSPPKDSFYMTDAFTDHAIEMIENHIKDNKDIPFFMDLSYTAPHWPLHAPEKDIAKYKGKFDKGWDLIRADRIAKQKSLGIIPSNIKNTKHPKTFPLWDELENKKEWLRKMEVYAAMIDHMDQQIGKVISLLEKEGMLDNTLIIFLSDNGASAEKIDLFKLNDPKAKIGAKGSFVALGEGWAHVANAPFRLYKGWVHEGGIKVPMIIHWPNGIKSKGKIIDAPCHAIDILPSLLELTGAKSSYPLRGLSLVPLMEGKSIPERALFWEFNYNKAVRKGDWKLVLGEPTYAWELYNLKDDPTESNNLYGINQEVFLKLRTLQLQWKNEMGIKH